MNLPSTSVTDEVICQCYQISENTIRNAITKANLKTIDSVTDSCEAGGGCHSCHILLQLFIDQHQKKNSTVEALVHDHAQKVKKKGILTRFFKKFKSAESSA